MGKVLEKRLIELHRETVEAEKDAGKLLKALLRLRGTSFKELERKYGLDLSTFYDFEKLKKRQRVTERFYRKLEELRYKTVDDAVTALQRGAVPTRYINEILSNGWGFIHDPLIEAIDKGYIITGKASHAAIETYKNSKHDFDERLRIALLKDSH